MVLVMVLHIRSKYTAVGRKEIVTFFYLYAVVELLSLFLDSSIIPASSNVYPVSRYSSFVHLRYSPSRRSGSPLSTLDSSPPHSGVCSSTDS